MATKSNPKPKVTDLIDPFLLGLEENDYNTTVLTDLATIYTNLELYYKWDSTNVCYHGRECTIYSRRLYKIKDQPYYLLTDLETEGDDLDVYDIPAQFDTETDFINKISTIISENELDSIEALGGNNNLDDIIPFYKKLYGSPKYKARIMEFAMWAIAFDAEKEEKDE